MLEYIEKNKKITASKVAKDWGWKNTQSYYEKKERETNQYDFLLFLNEKYNISAKKIFELLEAGRLKNAL